AVSFFAMVPSSSPSHLERWRRASTSTVEDVRRLAGRPRAFQTYSTPIGPTLISGCPRLVPASPSRYTTTLAAPSAKGRGVLGRFIIIRDCSAIARCRKRRGCGLRSTLRRSSAAVATSREGHRLPISSPAVQHRQLDRVLPGIPESRPLGTLYYGCLN